MGGFRVVAGSLAKRGGVPPGSDRAAFVVVHGSNVGRMFGVGTGTSSIGPDEASDVQIDADGVRGGHAAVVHDDAGVTIRDAGHGILVNGKSIDEARLCDGDVIRVGRGALMFLCGEDLQRKYEEELRRLSTVDTLTLAFNWRYFAKVLEHELDRSRRHDRPVSLLMVGLDHFSTYNECHGRLAGDELLCRIVEMARETTRSGSVVARHQSDVFVVILPNTRLELATAVGETLRHNVARTLPTTISIGVAMWDGSQGVDALVEQASERLRRAKQGGRNGIADS